MKIRVDIFKFESKRSPELVLNTKCLTDNKFLLHYQSFVNDRLCSGKNQKSSCIF